MKGREVSDRETSPQEVNKGEYESESGQKENRHGRSKMTKKDDTNRTQPQ